MLVFQDVLHLGFQFALIEQIDAMELESIKVIPQFGRADAVAHTCTIHKGVAIIVLEIQAIEFLERIAVIKAQLFRERSLVFVYFFLFLQFTNHLDVIQSLVKELVEYGFGRLQRRVPFDVYRSPRCDDVTTIEKLQRITNAQI